MSKDSKDNMINKIAQPQLASRVKHAFVTYWMPIVATCLFLASQWQLISYWSKIWDQKESYYSHGPLVPILACVMVWMNKERLSAIRWSGSASGLILMALAIPLYMFGRLSSEMGAAVPAFFLLLWGTILCMFGKNVKYIFIAPVLFLLLMIPLPSWLLDSLTGRFQTISTILAANILQLSGLDIVRQGNIISSSALPQSLVIGVPCSGLKLIIAIIMCNSFLCYAIQGRLWKKGVLFAAGLLIAIIINALRIVMIGAVGVMTESADSMKAFHDYSGYIGLVLCALSLLGLARLMGMRSFQEFAPTVISQSTADSSKTVSVVSISAIVVLFALSLGSRVITPLYDLPKGHIQRGSVPGSFGEWTATDLPIDEKTKTELGKGDLLNRLYTSSDSGRSVQVFVNAAIHQSAFHYPHSCLPSSGNTIEEERIITLNLKTPTKATYIRTSSKYGSGIMMIYWYQWGEDTFARTEGIRVASTKNSLWYFRKALLNPFSIANIQSDIQSRQIVWYRFSTEIVNQASDEQLLRSFIGKFVKKQTQTQRVKYTVSNEED